MKTRSCSNISVDRKVQAQGSQCDVQAGVSWKGAPQLLISGSNLLRHCSDTWIWPGRRTPDGLLFSHYTNVLKESLELVPNFGIMRNVQYGYQWKSYKNSCINAEKSLLYT